MIIVSQKKEAIINFTMAKSINVIGYTEQIMPSEDPKHIYSKASKELADIYALVVDMDTFWNGTIIGSYSTEEKAMKVLKIIYTSYSGGERVFEMPSESQVE